MATPTGKKPINKIRAGMTCALWVACILVLLANCSTDPKFQQYYVQGEVLYAKHCSNCHQKNGKGLGLVYPPLDESDFMQKNLEEVICIMKKGKQGKLTVNGREYNQPMPGNPLLTDLEVAEIATYIYNTWNHQRGIITVQEAEKIIEGCN